MRISDNITVFSYRDHDMPTYLSMSAPKKATNVTLPETLLAEAKALEINVSKAAESGLTQAVAHRRAEIWRQENQEAIASSNAYAEEHGLPLRRLRMF